MKDCITFFIFYQYRNGGHGPIIKATLPFKGMKSVNDIPEHLRNPETIADFQEWEKAKPRLITLNGH